MSRFKAKKQMIPLLLVTLFLVSTACSFSLFEEQTATPQPPVTVVVTKVITQIVPPTETPIATDVPVGNLTPVITIGSSGRLKRMAAWQAIHQRVMAKSIG